MPTTKPEDANRRSHARITACRRKAKAFRGGLLPRLAGAALLMASLSAAAALPDLMVRVDFDGPARARPGEDLGSRLTITVINRSKGVARGTRSAGKKGYMVDLFLTRSQLPAGFAQYAKNYHDGVLLRGGRISNTHDLGASAKRSYRTGAGLPADTKPGNYRLCAHVDPGKVVRESNESNNISCYHLKVTPLQVGTLTGPMATLKTPLPPGKFTAAPPNTGMLTVVPGPASPQPGPTRRVLADGTLEISYPDGLRRQLRPDGKVITIAPDGSITVPFAIQVQPAALPQLPAELADWGSEVNDRLLGIVRSLLSEAEFQAYRQTEAGKSFYELMDWRLRSIGFLATAP